MGYSKNILMKLAIVLAIIVLFEALDVNGVKIKRRRGGSRVGKAAPVTIAGFTPLAHKVASGEVTFKDSRTVSIKKFNYDGAGPDAYFLVGKGEPNAKGRKIANENGSFEVLEGYENQNIELLLPQDLSWKDIDYLSVYCVSFKHNFGYIKIPKNMNLPEYDDGKKA